MESDFGRPEAAELLASDCLDLRELAEACLEAGLDDDYEYLSGFDELSRYGFAGQEYYRQRQELGAMRRDHQSYGDRAVIEALARAEAELDRLYRQTADETCRYLGDYLAANPGLLVVGPADRPVQRLSVVEADDQCLVIEAIDDANSAHRLPGRLKPAPDGLGADRQRAWRDYAAKYEL